MYERVRGKFFKIGGTFRYVQFSSNWTNFQHLEGCGRLPLHWITRVFANNITRGEVRIVIFVVHLSIFRLHFSQPKNGSISSKGGADVTDLLHRNFS